MKYVFCLSAILLLSGCQWSYDEVQVATKSCEDKGGKVSIKRFTRGIPHSVSCIIDGLVFPVSVDGSM